MAFETDDARNGFGPLLRVWRKRASVSLREFAGRVHVDYSYLSKVERGIRIAGRELAEACDLELNAGGVLVAAWSTNNLMTVFRPAQLPAMTSNFVDRHRECGEVAEYCGARRAVGAARVVVIDGPPGVGKTSLALRCANELASEFPDGVLFTDLHGFSESAPVDVSDVLERFLFALGVAPAAIPTDTENRAALFRSVLYGRRVLIVLDNARGSAQVRPLLPTAPGCGVVVTSRAQLTGLVARDCALTVTLRPLAQGPAVDVLRGIVGDERVNAEPQAAVALARYCSGLPLALCGVAERLISRPQSMLSDLVDAGPLSALASTEDVSLDIRRAFSWSYRTLPADSAYLFRMLSLYWGPDIVLDAVAALAGWPTHRTREGLDVLLRMRLIEEPEQDRFLCHDVFRWYANELNGMEDCESDRKRAVDRLLGWYLAAVRAGSRVMAPYRRHPDDIPVVEGLSLPAITNRTEAVAWYDRELPALVAATERALTSGNPAAAYRIPIEMCDFLLLRRPWSAWLRMSENGLAAAVRSGDVAAETCARLHLGVVRLDMGESDAAINHFERANELGQQLGDRVAEGWGSLCLGNIQLSNGDAERGAGLLEQSLAAFTGAGDQWATGICHGYLGAAYIALARFTEAEDQLASSGSVLGRLGDVRGEGFVLHLTAKLHLAREDWSSAIDYLRRASRLRGTIGDSRGLACTLFALGKLQHRLGQYTGAHDSYTHALELFAERGDPERQLVHTHLWSLRYARRGTAADVHPVGDHEPGA